MVQQILLTWVGYGTLGSVASRRMGTVVVGRIWSNRYYCGR